MLTENECKTSTLSFQTKSDHIWQPHFDRESTDKYRMRIWMNWAMRLLLARSVMLTPTLLYTMNPVSASVEHLDLVGIEDGGASFNK